MTNTTPISLYIHIPWCVKKCPYCDFNSHQRRGDPPFEHYFDCLLADFKQKQSWLQNRSIKSIFIGGGTPSLAPGRFYAKLLRTIADLAQVRLPDIEITLEANPGTVDEAFFADYLAAGINRLSIGVQSFDSNNLQRLGRIHDSHGAHHAINTAHRVGFDNINVDIMFGLPSQTLANSLRDLEQAMATNPTHLSWYQLTIEPNTYFHKHPPMTPASEIIWEMQQQGYALLKANEYIQYEVSAYSKDRPCQHNLNYWLFGDYIGIGAGAHSKVTDFNTQTIYRLENTSSPNSYMKLVNNFVKQESIVSTEDKLIEFFMNAFRLPRSYSWEFIEQRTGLEKSLIKTKLDKIDSQLIDINVNKVALTDKGFQFLNEVLISLI